MKTLIFTDIDGTLTDHHTYSTSLAKKALNELKERAVPIILCSSKTFDEQRHLQTVLDIDFPFIIENGSAIIFHNDYFSLPVETIKLISDKHSMIALAQRGSKEIKRALVQIGNLQSYKLYGYADSTDNEIESFTGLKGVEVARAKNRWFTESLFSKIIRPDDLLFLDKVGLKVSQGGRFWTIQDRDVDKGKAVRSLIELFEQKWQEKILTVGIGDSPNDASFLEVVDRPFLVKRHDNTWAEMDIAQLTKIDAIGPLGFVAVLDYILK